MGDDGAVGVAVIMLDVVDDDNADAVIDGDDDDDPVIALLSASAMAVPN